MIRERLWVGCVTCVTAAAVMILPALSVAAASAQVTFRTDDGVTIAATFYEASRRPAPAVILLHMLTRSRDDWRSFADRLSDAGIHALAIDFRGHGASSGSFIGADGEPDLSRLVLDVRAARGYLTARPDVVRSSAIGVAGASVGATIALLEAAADPTIKSVALLSPGLEYRSLRSDAPMRKYGRRPALLVAGSNDSYALRSIRQLVAIGGGGIRETKTLDNGGHGTTMLARDPELTPALVDWFERTLL